jgi:predicted MFS family arabinose efflux permease
LEKNSSASPAYITGLLMIYGVGWAIGNFIAGHNVKRSRGPPSSSPAPDSWRPCCCSRSVIGGVGTIMLLVLWGASFGAWQLAQVSMTLAAAPGTFEAAMSLNTVAYNTSIALGALFGGLFADTLGVSSVLWFGAALTAASLIVTLGARRAASRSRPTPGGMGRERQAVSRTGSES